MYRWTDLLPFFNVNLCPVDGAFFFAGIGGLEILRVGIGWDTGGKLSSEDSALIISHPSSSDEDSPFRVRLYEIKSVATILALN